MYKIEIWRFHRKCDEFKSKDVKEVLKWYKRHYLPSYNACGCMFYLYHNDEECDFETLSKMGFFDE